MQSSITSNFECAVLLEIEEHLHNRRISVSFATGKAMGSWLLWFGDSYWTKRGNIEGQDHFSAIGIHIISGSSRIEKLL
ncbi:unnamed protein product [Prunus armeniaca]|uniref:Uncharacterized protein n=1 Tax=Prunus armeniaca TaxID=36596 RepID=A0A6J5TUD8_PRUAR|nr:unnamed protein product [Prunus armeniaca]